MTTFRFLAIAALGLVACDRVDRPVEAGHGKSANELDTLPPIYQVINGRGVAEAEHFSAQQQDTTAPIHSWVEQSAPATGAFAGAAGGKYMRTTPDAASSNSATSPPALLYQFEVPANAGGTYLAYVRGAGPNSGGDSWHATITTAAGTPIGAATTQSQTTVGVWGWQGTPTVTLTPGRYAVRVAMREDGVAVDKVVLQQSSLSAPAGEGPAESPWVSTAQPFAVWSPASGFVKPTILIQAQDPAGLAFDWTAAAGLDPDSVDARAALRDAALYLQEGIRKMTGQSTGWAITSKPLDVTTPTVILLTTLAQAPQEIRDDPRVIATLTATSGTNYGVETRESYYVRTEANRTVIVANRFEGLVAAVPELLESVDYEVIGMGPNWVHIPNRSAGLTFNFEKGARPAFFSRFLTADVQGRSGQGALSYEHVEYGMPVPTAPDEFVQTSYNRWLVGRRMRTAAVPKFDTAAQPISYHADVIKEIRAKYAPGAPIRGFLAETTLGPNSERLLASPATLGALWLNSDDTRNFRWTQVGPNKVWVEFATTAPSTSLDVSQPYVRTILLKAMAANADEHCFEPRPNDECVVMVEPEDHIGYEQIALAKEDDGVDHSGPQWFKTYRESRGSPFLTTGYRLHGFNGLVHPGESWDPLSPSDFVYGLDNWLLREYDETFGNQTTSTGKRKKDLIRLTHYSYNFWDVPANFNSDDRIRVAVSGHSKNRRRGQWSVLAKYSDVFDAFERMFPNWYQSYRWTYSLDTSVSNRMDGIVGSSAMATAKELRNYARDGNCRGMFWGEADLNFGKYGLMYYLLTRVMLTPEMSDADLLAAFERWHQRAYGAGSEAMKAYHDLVLNGVPAPVRGPQLWAEAMKRIDEAYAAQNLDSASRQRLDDLKTHWYHYHFVDKNQRNANVPEFREFVWKGQMAYQAYLRQNVNVINAANPALPSGAGTVPYFAANFGDSDFGNGRAHYTPLEINGGPGTGGWWPLLKVTWPWVNVVRFNDPQVNLNDLVQVTEFGTTPAEFPYYHNGSNGANPGPVVRAATAGTEIGLQIAWHHKEGWNNQQPKDVFWGVKQYDTAKGDWDVRVDVETNMQPSQQVPVRNAPDPNQISIRNVVRIKYLAPSAGMYKFELGPTGDGARFVDLNWDVAANPFDSGKGAYRGPFTFTETTPSFAAGLWWFYAPKGTTTLDFQYPIATANRTLTIHKRSGAGFVPSRGPLAITNGGVKRIALTAEETAAGCLLAFNTDPPPHFFSLPIIWAKSQSQLLVPRKIAERDGLTILP